MSFWRKLFGLKDQPSFKNVDWMEVDQRLRMLRSLSASSAQADAKQLLIQSDILVDSILKQAGVIGTTFGERLKTMKSMLPNPVYRKLWQAHIKRNELVHETGSFVADWEKTSHFNAFQEAVSTIRGLR